MKTTNKKTYLLPQVTRVELDSDISLTLDSSLTPMADPESLMMNNELMTPDPLSIGIL
jgi:hypothetical protein